VSEPEDVAADRKTERCAYWYQYDKTTCDRPESDPVHSEEAIAKGISDWGHRFWPEPVSPITASREEGQ